MPGTLIQKSGHRDLYDKRIGDQFLDSYGGPEHEFEKILRVDNMDTEDKRFSFQSGFGKFQEAGESSGLVLDTIYQGYQTIVTYYQYKSGFRVSEMAYSDDKTGILSGDLATALATAARESVEYYAAVPFNNATSATGCAPWMTGGDGVALLSTMHPLAAGGVFANTPTAQVNLSVASMQQGVTTMRKTLNERGFRSPQTPTKLVYPTDSRFLAREILQTDTMPYSADNTVNMLAKDGISGQEWSQLTNANSWFLMAAPAGKPGQKGHTMTFFWRRKPTFDRLPQDGTRDRVYDATIWFAVAYVGPRGIYGCSP